MDMKDWILLFGGLGGTGTVSGLYWWARNQGKADAVAEAADNALKQEKEKSAALEKEKSDIEAENQTLWSQNAQAWEFMTDVIDLVTETRELVKEERQERLKRNGGHR